MSAPPHAVPLIHRSPPPCLGQVALHGQQTCPAHSRDRSGAPPHHDVQVAAPAAVAHPVLDVLIILVNCRLVPKVRPPAPPPDARPLQRTLARQSTAPFIETLGPPPCTWPAARCSSSLTATFRHCVRRAASCCRRRVLPASCGRSPALPLALAAPVLSLFLFLRVRSSGLCEFCESFLVSFESSFVTSDSSVSVSVWFFLI